jgi:hypothetical protein
VYSLREFPCHAKGEGVTVLRVIQGDDSDAIDPLDPYVP